MKFARSIGLHIVLTGLFSFAVLARGAAPLSKQARHSAIDKSFFLYIGTFINSTPNGHPDGNPQSKGIYMSRFNAETGALSEPVLAAEVGNPTFLLVSPNQRFLYALTEIDPEAFVSSYAIDPHTGELHLLERQPTGGAGTAYMSLDKTGKFILLANWGSASVTVIQINSDGTFGRLTSFVQHSTRRARDGKTPLVPRPHAAVASPDNRFVLVPDVELNKIFVYKFDAEKGILATPATITDLPPDDGPRHFVFSPDGRFGYMIAQTTGNVEVFRWDQAAGTLSLVQTVTTFPKGLDAVNISAEIGITHDGTFLYESNRRTRGREQGPDSIEAFQIDRESGTLTKIQDLDLDGSIPRCFSIDPTGKYMAIGGQQANRIAVYRIGQEDGRLSDTGVSISIHTPACMQFAHAQ